MQSLKSRNLLYSKITKKYGFEAQREKWIEELLELATALQQSKFKESNVPEEIADVEICIEQMRLHYNTEEIDSIKSDKLNALPIKLNV